MLQNGSTLNTRPFSAVTTNKIMKSLLTKEQYQSASIADMVATIKELSRYLNTSCGLTYEQVPLTKAIESIAIALEYSYEN